MPQARAWRFALWVALAGLLVTVVLAEWVWDREMEDADGLLVDHGQVLADSVDEAFDEVVERLVAVGAFYQGSEEVTQTEFRRFVANFDPISGMGGIGYIPVVAGEDLDAYQAEIADVIPGFFVFELDEEGNRVPVGSRNTYAPVQWFEPAHAFDQPHGFDTASEPNRRAALARAGTTGEATATPFLRLLSETESDGFLVYLRITDPVLGDLTGYTFAAMDLEEMLAGNIPAALSDDLAWSIADLTSLPTVPSHTADEGWSEILDVGGRRWGLTVTPTESSQFLPDRTRPISVFVSGLAISLLAAAGTYLQRRKSEAQHELQQLQELARAKDQFLASVSHELRTPLTSVLGFAEMLRDNSRNIPDAERKAMIGSVAEEASELASIIDDLLVAARAELDLLAITTVPVSLRAQLAQVLECNIDTTRQHIEILDETPEGTRALGDPGRVRQIIRNLMTNACRYGGDRIEIRFSCHDGMVRLAVADNGPGLPSEAWDRIFEPYYRAHGEDSQPAALGIGLSISRHLARLMEGELTFRREAGWSVFELALPAVPAVEAVDKPATNPAVAVLRPR